MALLYSFSSSCPSKCTYWYFYLFSFSLQDQKMSSHIRSTPSVCHIFLPILLQRVWSLSSTTLWLLGKCMYVCSLLRSFCSPNSLSLCRSVIFFHPIVSTLVLQFALLSEVRAEVTLASYKQKLWELSHSSITTFFPLLPEHPQDKIPGFLQPGSRGKNDLEQKCEGHEYEREDYFCGLSSWVLESFATSV